MINDISIINIPNCILYFGSKTINDNFFINCSDDKLFLFNSIIKFPISSIKVIKYLIKYLY